MPIVNPEILRWARKTAGFSAEQAVTRLHIRPARGESAIQRLSALEAGNVEPRRTLLLAMAKQYHRPLLTFYLSTPPRKGERGEDFRTLPKNYSPEDDALLDVMLREVRARQSLLRAALEDEEEAEPLPFISSARKEEGLPSILASIQKHLQLSLPQFRAERTPEDAFALLRAKTEATGILVLLIGDLGSHHTRIPLETFRGFALADPAAPFVIINDHDSRAAWSFTLLHELTHLWLGQTAISGITSEQPIEEFCNDVASEYLLPSDEVQEVDVRNSTEIELAIERIGLFARERNISSSMVAYKLYRKRFIDRTKWSQLSKVFYDLWLQHRSRERERVSEDDGGPSYYTVRRHRLGGGLLNVVQRMVKSGALTTSKAATVLGVKSVNVQKLLDVHGPSVQ